MAAPDVLALFGASPPVGHLLGYRGVVDGVVAGVKEDGRSGDASRRPRCIEHSADAEHCRRDAGDLQGIAP